MNRTDSRQLFFQILFFSFLLSTAGLSIGQELYPIAEPASNVPKGALGARLFGEGYPEAGLVRSLLGAKLLFGITPRLSVYVTATESDYHEKTLPFDFITHDHSGGNVIPGTKTPQQGIPYPMIFNSIDAYAKYRFLSIDGANSHFRMAAYGEASHVAVPSHEAEPDLLIHTSGWGMGLIATWLKQHFAASFTGGFILPHEYQGDARDIYNGIYPTTIQYGRAINYSLSLGYLLLPRRYSRYDQTNVNLYCEFLGKSYGAAKIYQADGPGAGATIYTVPVTTPILQAGNYVDVCPGIQFIIRSTYRIDASVELPLVNKSYDHLYPLCLLGFQRYFYFHGHSKRKEKSE